MELITARNKKKPVIGIHCFKIGTIPTVNTVRARAPSRTRFWMMDQLWFTSCCVLLCEGKLGTCHDEI